jgi:hypothetical protein
MNRKTGQANEIKWQKGERIHKEEIRGKFTEEVQQ